jgi:inosine/xanthosine triphosphatase
LPILIGAGTTSKLKIRAIEKAYERLNPDIKIFPTEVTSIVPAQPFGIEQIHMGAVHRAVQGLTLNNADIGVGIESGIIDIEEQNWFDVPGVAIVQKLGLTTFSLGAFFPIPYSAIAEIRTKNLDLGEVAQARAQGGEKDPEKWFSESEVDREEIMIQAILCALTPIRHPTRYK